MLLFKLGALASIKRPTSDGVKWFEHDMRIGNRICDAILARWKMKFGNSLQCSASRGIMHTENVQTI